MVKTIMNSLAWLGKVGLRHLFRGPAEGENSHPASRLASGSTLLQDGFQLRYDLKIFWPSGCAFDVNQTLQRKALALDPEEANDQRIFQQVCVAPSSGSFSEKDDRA